MSGAVFSFFLVLIQIFPMFVNTHDVHLFPLAFLHILTMALLVTGYDVQNIIPVLDSMCHDTLYTHTLYVCAHVWRVCIRMSGGYT